MMNPTKKPVNQRNEQCALQETLLFDNWELVDKPTPSGYYCVRKTDLGSRLKIFFTSSGSVVQSLKDGEYNPISKELALKLGDAVLRHHQAKTGNKSIGRTSMKQTLEEFKKYIRDQ